MEANYAIIRTIYQAFNAKCQEREERNVSALFAMFLIYFGIFQGIC